MDKNELENEIDKKLVEIGSNVPFPALKTTVQLIMDFDLSALSDEEIAELEQTDDYLTSSAATILHDEKLLKIRIELDQEEL